MRLFSATILGLGALLAAPSAFAHKENAMLKYTMKSIAQDMNAVWVPAKKPDASDVLDGQILTAITRARTAAYQLQLIVDRKEGEMLPGGVDELPADKQKQMKALFADYLIKAKAGFDQSEKLLNKELLKKNAEDRDFKSLRALLTDLERLIAEAHKAFRPE